MKSFSKSFVRVASCFAVSTLCISLFSGCGSARKQRESRKKREALVEKHGLYCDLVKVDPDLEMEVELNIKMVNSCEPNSAHSITYYPLDAEIRGILFCCTHKKPELPQTSTESEINHTLPVDKSSISPSPTPAPTGQKKSTELSAPKKR